MHESADYQIQFYRQWLGDSDIEDLPAACSLAQARTLAQVNLENIARTGAGRGRPRVARIVETQTHAVLAEFRMTQDGPVEVTRRAAATPKLRLVESTDTLTS
jgi:hypothetical protein